MSAALAWIDRKRAEVELLDLRFQEQEANDKVERGFRGGYRGGRGRFPGPGGEDGGEGTGESGNDGHEQSEEDDKGMDL